MGSSQTRAILVPLALQGGSLTTEPPGRPKSLGFSAELSLIPETTVGCPEVP